MQVCFVTHHTGFDPDTTSGTWLEDTVASYQSTGTASSPLKPQDEIVWCTGNSCANRDALTWKQGSTLWSHSMRALVEAVGRKTLPKSCKTWKFPSLEHVLQLSSQEVCFGLTWVAWGKVPERIPSRGIRRTFQVN